jgi:hypothetical protein
MLFLNSNMPADEIVTTFEHELAHRQSESGHTLIAQVKKGVNLNLPATRDLRDRYNRALAFKGSSPLTEAAVREEVAAYFLSGFSMPGLDLSKAFKDPKQALGLAIQYHATQADRLRFPSSEFAGGSAQPPQAAPNVNAGLGDTANAERFPAGKVRIQSPQGNFLYIPEERLQSAFRAGYKLAPERQSPKASIGKGLHAPAADEVRTADAARSTKTGSNVTRLGIKRRNPADWRATRDLWDKAGYGGVLSDANRVAIARGRTPVVDGPWIRYFPEDAEEVQ